MSKELINSIYEGIKDASYIIYEVARWTPLNISNNLSKMAGANIYLKLENMQRTGSFKLRGAYYAMKKINEKYIITVSDGNHAQGAALSATLLNKDILVVMPEYTSHVKISATLDYGAKVKIFGKTYDEAMKYAEELAIRENAVFLHPYNDINVIAGNGTIGYELLHDNEDISMILVPIGGGALISGILVYIKKKKPNIKVIGVQTKAAPSTKLSLEAKEMKIISPKPTIAEGIAMSSPGEVPYKIISELVDDVVVVDDDDIAYALYILMERVKTVAEPAGAISVAPILNGLVKAKDNTVAIISGGNIDAPLLSKVILEGMNKTGRLLRVEVALIDKPGELEKFLKLLTDHRANIINIMVDYTAKVMSPSYSKVILLVEVFSKNDKEVLITEIENAGYSVLFYE